MAYAPASHDAPVVMAGLLLAGCAVATSAPETSSAVMNSDEAVVTFRQICGAGLPDFASSIGRARAAGFTLPAGEGTLRHATQDATLYAGRGDDGEPLCALDFATGDTAQTADRAFAGLARLTEIQPGIRIGRFDATLMRLSGPLEARGRTRYVLELKPEG